MAQEQGLKGVRSSVSRYNGMCMKQVAKLVIVDDNDNYLLMYRSDHPTYGNDPDLPGGTAEDAEQPLAAAIREVYEETAITVGEASIERLYEGSAYSMHHTYYHLFRVCLSARPAVRISWEHSAYEWLPRQDFLQKIEHAKDTYMHMVYDTLKD